MVECGEYDCHETAKFVDKCGCVFCSKHKTLRSHSKTKKITKQYVENRQAERLAKEFKKMQDKHECVLCGETFNGFGSDPEPLSKKGRCCKKCYSRKVVFARMNAKNIPTKRQNVKDLIQSMRDEVLEELAEKEAILKPKKPSKPSNKKPKSPKKPTKSIWLSDIAGLPLMVNLPVKTKGDVTRRR